MGPIAGNSVSFRVSRVSLIAGARIVVLGTILAGVGCIIVPVPSVTPDNETGIIDEATLESLTGLGEEEVIGRIGQPDFSGPRGHSYMMVYQGEKTYSTDIYAAGTYFMIPIAGKADTTYTNVVHCFVMELDENHVVQGYYVVDDAPRGTMRDSSDEQVAPIADCAEAVWEPEERDEILAMKAAANREARIAELEVQAGQGNRRAAIELVGLTGNLAPLRTLAETGDTRAAVEIAAITGSSAVLVSQAEEGNAVSAFVLHFRLTDERQTFVEAWRWLCVAANGGNGAAQAKVGHWHRRAIWQSGVERLMWLHEEMNIRPDDRVAHMWYTLAESNGYEWASRKVGLVEENMTPDEIAQAKQMTRDWKPGDCPSAERRLGVSDAAYSF